LQEGMQNPCFCISRHPGHRKKKPESLEVSTPIGFRPSRNNEKDLDLDLYQFKEQLFDILDVIPLFFCNFQSTDLEIFFPSANRPENLDINIKKINQ
jgi:hypothetical protein